MEETKTEKWAIIATGDGKYYLGNVVERNGTVLTANPCYEYISQVKGGMDQQGNMVVAGRQHMVLPFDNCLSDVPVRLVCLLLVFLDEMEVNDRKVYIKMIETRKEQNAQLKLKRDSNLVVVPGGSVPPNLQS